MQLQSKNGRLENLFLYFLIQYCCFIHKYLYRMDKAEFIQGASYWILKVSNPKESAQLPRRQSLISWYQQEVTTEVITEIP